MGHSCGKQLAVVIIGRNEGERLRRSLQSVEEMRKPEGGIECVYVDTASTDGSVELAERAGVRTVRLSFENPSAARARNAGWRAASAPFVLFLDGDSQIEPEFAMRALERFADPQVAIVWGRLREAYPAASIYNRMMHAQWICLRTLAEGPCFYGTGIGLVRRQALEAVEGFNEKMINGQNTELGRRMQAKGYEVLHIAEPMVRHDAEMLRWGQYWRRFFREGYSYARLEEVFRNSNQPLFRFEFSHVGGALMTFGPPLAVVLGIVMRGWQVPFVAACVLLLSIMWTAMSYRARANGFGVAMVFGLHWHLKLIPNYFGHLAYQGDRKAGRDRALMEYRK